MARLTKEAKLDLEHTVWELAANKFMDERQIARRLSIPPKQVREILARVAERLHEHMRVNAGHYASRQLSRYEWIAAQAQEAYLKSAVNQVTAVKKTEQIFDTDGKEIGMKVKTDERVKVNNVGNPAHLDIMLRALDAESKIVAGERPELNHMTESRNQLTDDDRKRLLITMLNRMEMVKKEALQLSDTTEAEYDISTESDAGE